MTIAWAIVVVAVLYLLDKHNLLRKTLRVVGIAALILVSVTAVVLAGNYEWGKWEDYRFAAKHECFSSSTRKVHPISDGGGCLIGEGIHERGTPLPVDEYTTPIPAGATNEPSDDVFIANPEYKPISPGTIWDKAPLAANEYTTPIPPGSCIGTYPCKAPLPSGTANEVDEYTTPIPPGATDSPVPFGNASCSGHRYERVQSNTILDGAPLPPSPPGGTANDIVETGKFCALITGDPRFEAAINSDHTPKRAFITDGGRLIVLGKSTPPQGWKFSGFWYGVKTAGGHEGYLPDTEVHCDGEPAGVTADQTAKSWVNNPQYKSPPASATTCIDKVVN